MKIGFAQLNTTVGDLRGNAEKILAAYRDLVKQGAELVLTPELALTGYPPQDLVFKSRFVPLNLEKLDELHRSVGEVPLLVGFIDINHGSGQPFHNAAAVLQRGQPLRKVHKSLLPTYDVFDEDRYFEPAKCVEPIEIAGKKFGVTICEDIWTEKYLPRRLYGNSPVGSLVEQGIEAILNLSASPFSIGKAARRAEMLGALAREHRLPIHYCNAIGGNDQLVFDGNSLAFDATGALHTRLAPFAEECAVVELNPSSSTPVTAFPSAPEELFYALSLGTRDYLHKCGFHSTVLGLSGGIDSAVTACIAAHALGTEHVLGVTMPTQYSSQGSVDDSLAIAKNLGIRCLTIPIQRSFETFREQFREVFTGLPEDTTEENMQPRLRGMTLMALSNKFGSLLLTTGNKSELAVGYCTLYGDMCGGLAVISDVPKTMVYELAEWINRDREIIPRATIEKPPSAELKPDQRDQDTLPPYEVLDPILQLYVEEQLSGAEIIARGFDEKTVRWVVRRVDLNEYKRAQAVPGLKVTGRAFGLGRKMPVAQRFVE
ncbi:NAD+ synthetase [Chthoniobacter flavus Ellin428]|uniref:Glutamine-dependent NAD(+) synthetase n=1 Tax=Chthoniobacter flavus Ellin428 TaxID=497964 RepID=B4D1D3_9BACT|nr:NAD+ synthase [Chthoniobacter flavus]EDY19545.1 NAD+ synthetase [Chthoniobacter flavus Ellin428]TCO92789.1 NAD+ synthase (glutamine-hydrolysing) [Chthoniobacter flavus]